MLENVAELKLFQGAGEVLLLTETSAYFHLP